MRIECKISRLYTCVHIPTGRQRLTYLAMAALKSGSFAVAHSHSHAVFANARVLENCRGPMGLFEDFLSLGSCFVSTILFLLGPNRDPHVEN